ncbi:MAG: VOC family protein [Bdellovibrionales bacterium]
MKDGLKALLAAVGHYQGEGINHEGQAFQGTFILKSKLGGQGLDLSFLAKGKDGDIFHQEESVIAPSLDEKLMLWNLNNNVPGLVSHELRPCELKQGAKTSLRFGFGEVSDKSRFREEISIDLWNNGDVSYTYFWGLPGGEFKERSGVRMGRCESDREQVEFLSATLMVSDQAQELARFYRETIGLPLEDEQHGDTQAHYGCELGDLHFAIHPRANFPNQGEGKIKLAFAVKDMASFVKRLESKGVALAYPPKDLGFAKMTALTDPDGHYVEFTELSKRWLGHIRDRRQQGHDILSYIE